MLDTDGENVGERNVLVVTYHSVIAFNCTRQLKKCPRD